MPTEPAERDLPLHVEERGEGPPVVLVHGFAASSFTWRHWVPDLALTHRVLSVDLKGHGRAAKPDDGRYGPRDQAELLVDLVRRRDLRDLVLVGHSLGGGIALMVALLLEDAGEADRLRGIVSVAGVAFPQRFPRYIGLTRRRPYVRGMLGTFPTRWVVRRVIRQIVYEPGEIGEALVQGYAEPLREAATRMAIVDTALQILPPDVDLWTSRYHRLDMPTLLLWGAADRVVPLWVGERLARELSRARLVVLPECGHMPPDEQPAASLRVVRDFLEGLRLPGGPGAS